MATTPDGLSGQSPVLSAMAGYDSGLSRPPLSVPDAALVGPWVEQVLASGALSNGAVVRELEQRAASYLGVRHCVAAASGSAALTVALRALDVAGEVVLASFSPATTLHAARWSGLDPVFADIDPETLALTPTSIDGCIGTRTGVILATHPLGTPCDVEALSEMAAAHGLRLLFDAAAAFGAEHGGRMVGSHGDAEVFSLSSNKMLVAGEGGLIATNDDLLAERCRRARDDGPENSHPSGLIRMNARMSELHAAVALASFETLDERLRRRRELATRYRRSLEGLVGVSFPRVRQGDLSTHLEWAVLVDTERVRSSADDLVAGLRSRGVAAHRTCPSPAHQTEMYRHLRVGCRLRDTELAAARAISLPLWDAMSTEEVDATASALHDVLGAA